MSATKHCVVINAIGLSNRIADAPLVAGTGSLNLPVTTQIDTEGNHSVSRLEYFRAATTGKKQGASNHQQICFVHGHEAYSNIRLMTSNLK
jgi:hypothetical protein